MSSKLLLLFVSFKSRPIMTVLSLMMPKFLFSSLRNRLYFPWHLPGFHRRWRQNVQNSIGPTSRLRMFTLQSFLENWAWEKELREKQIARSSHYILFDHCLRPISVDKSLGYFRTTCHFKLKVILVFWLLLLRVSGDNYN